MKQQRSTIKFPQEFVKDTSLFAKENGWHSSSEFIIAAIEYIRKNGINLHGELSPFIQTDISFLVEKLRGTTEALKDIPERLLLIRQNNTLKMELMTSQKDLARNKSSLSAWKNEAETQKSEKFQIQGKFENKKEELAVEKNRVAVREDKLKAINQKVGQCLQEIENENSFMGKDKKKLDLALTTLKWILAQHEKPP